MRVKILKTFMGRHGMLRAGEFAELEPGYAQSLAGNKLVELPEGAAVPKAPNPQSLSVGVSRPGSGRHPVREAPLGDGPDMTPLSSRAARALAKKTANSSGSGEKTGSAAKKKAPKKNSKDQNQGGDAS